MIVSIIGLGYIGLPTAIVLAKAGHQVYGFDVNEQVVNKLNSGHIHIKENKLDEAYNNVLKTGRFKANTKLMDADVYIIAVPTPFIKTGEGKGADMTYVEKATSEIAKRLKKGDLVILESTSPPQTTRTMTKQLAKESGLGIKDFHTAYCPERVLPGNILYELEHNDRIIGSEFEESALIAKGLYQTFVKFGNIYTTDDITAEMCKLVENSYRDVNIAFANELSIICNKLEIDVNELIGLSNKHPRVNILSPGVGVGGHCLAVDPYFIVGQFKDDAKLISMARDINEYKTSWVAMKIVEKIEFDKTAVIGILGLAYKPNIDDFRESPSIKLAKYLTDKGYIVIACEPNANGEHVDSVPLYSLEEVLEKANLCVMTLKHDEFVEKSELISKHNIINLC